MWTKGFEDMTIEKGRLKLQDYDNTIYHMPLFHKDWELPNSRIWLAEIDIDRCLDFPI